MTSPVEICNQALSWLGAKRIMSIDDNTDEARLCKANYIPLRDAVLEERTWAFADASLALTAPEDHAWGTGYRYAIPTDVLKIYRVFRDVSNSGNPAQADWQREGNSIIAAHNGTCYCKATMIIADPNLWSSMFVQAFAARMAADFAIPLTRSKSLQRDMWQLYEAKLLAACSSDSSQGRSMRTNSTELIGARHRSGGASYDG